MKFIEIITDMHNKDCENKTDNVWFCIDFVGAETRKQWWVVTMWVPKEVIVWMAKDEYIPVLLMIKKSEYKKYD